MGRVTFLATLRASLSGTFLQILPETVINHWRALFNLRAAVYRRCQRPSKGFYGCETWACKKTDVISELQLRFLKLILGGEVTTPTCMVFGEVGRYPIEIEAKCRMLGFWYGLCSTSHFQSPKISNLMFQLCSKLYSACDYKLPWLMKVHSLLDCEQVLFVRFTIIPPRLTDQCSFITVL